MIVAGADWGILELDSVVQPVEAAVEQGEAEAAVVEHYYC